MYILATKWKDIPVKENIKKEFVRQINMNALHKQSYDEILDIMQDLNYNNIKLDKYIPWVIARISEKADFNRFSEYFNKVSEYFELLEKYDILRRKGKLDGWTGKIRNFKSLDDLKYFIEMNKDYFIEEEFISKGWIEIEYEKKRIKIISIKDVRAWEHYGKDFNYTYIAGLALFIIDKKRKKKYFIRWASNVYTEKGELNKEERSFIIDQYPMLLNILKRNTPLVVEYYNKRR